MRTFSTCDELFSQGQAVFLPRNAPDTDRNGRPEGTTVLHVQLRHPTHQTCRNTKAWDGPPSVGPLGPLGKGLFCPTSAKGPPGPQARRGRVPAASPCYHGARPTKTNKVNRILHTVTRYFSHFSKIHGSIRSPPSAALPVVPPDAVVQGWLAAMGLGPHMVDSRCVRTRALV